jgi:hypothetical protein
VTKIHLRYGNTCEDTATKMGLKIELKQILTVRIWNLTFDLLSALIPKRSEREISTFDNFAGFNRKNKSKTESASEARKI